MRPLKLLCSSMVFLLFGFSCSKSGTADTATGNPPPGDTVIRSGDIDMWITTGDRSALLSERKNAVQFTSQSNQFPVIAVDSAKKYQTIDGFGFCLTDGSAYLINHMDATARAALVKELFSSDGHSIGISYLRISIGASDLSQSVYSYDDLPDGQTDLPLAHFSIAENEKDLIPVLKQILQIDPDIKILGSPWSPPAWMKTNNSSRGGSLKTGCYDAYAQYFVKYIQAMAAEGIVIDAVTPQNEPLNPDNNPSLYMPAEDEAAFIKNSLGPAFKNAGLSTRIIVYDHNCDVPQYPLTILKDTGAAEFVDGSAFHLYAGDISVLTQVHNAYPGKNIYFTEQYTPSSGSFAGDLSWHIQNLIIGAPRNWSRNVIEWNLASDLALGPHTSGGCTTCLGAVTINGSQVIRNQSYYIIAHASKFVRPGSVRIESGTVSDLPNVAFLTPDGKKVLIVFNPLTGTQSFNIKFDDKTAVASLNAGAVATYIW